MTENEIPETVRVLLSRFISSYEELEILLALHGEPEPGYHDEALAARLRLSPALVRVALESLQMRGLVSRRDGAPQAVYCYSPQDPKLHEAVVGLAREYREQPIAIIKLLSTNAIERVRTAALRTFADAFVIGKDKNRG